MPRNDPIESLLVTYAGAVHAKDLHAFLAAYAADVVIYDAWDRWEYRGRDTWRGFIERWFDSLGPKTVKVAVKELATQVDATLATGHAVLEFSEHDAEGRRLGALENRVTLVARKAGERWEVIHEHTSIPVPFATRPAAPR